MKSYDKRRGTEPRNHDRKHESKQPEGLSRAAIRKDGTGKNSNAGNRQPHRVLLDAMDEGVMVIRADGTITYANRTIAERLWIPSARASGHKFQDFLGPEQCREFADLLARGKSARHEFVLVASDRIRIPVRLSIRPLPSRGVRTFGLVISDQAGNGPTEKELHISEEARRQAAIASFGQHALQGDDSGELAAQAVKIVTEVLAVDACIVLELHADGQYFSVRASAGIDPPPGAGIPMTLEAFSQANRTLETQQTIVVDDYATSGQWSRVGWARSRGAKAGVTVLIPGTRRSYGVIEAYRTDKRKFGPQDLSFLQTLSNVFGQAVDRYHAERRARHAEEYYRSLIENFSEGIALDAQGSLLFVSRSFERMLGYSPGEALTADIFSLLHPSEHVSIRERLVRVFEQPHRAETFECRIRHKDESWRDFEITWQSTTGLVGNQIAIARLRDLTEHRLAERARELARSNAELERFAYVASHDLKEPLRAVALYAQLLNRHLSASEDSDVAEFLRHITQGAKRMQELIDALLAYARLAPKAPLLEEIDCSSLVNEVIGRLSDTIRSAQAQVAHDSLPTVQAERTLLGQLFQNLIGNALKFRGHEPPMIQIGALRQDREWLFSVSDNGIGIEPQYAERIFDMFERLHPPGEYPGTGMGLAICKKAVENLGGKIWVQSEPGRGSTFLFTLPAG